jgi:hypothetical protein
MQSGRDCAPDDTVGATATTDGIARMACGLVVVVVVVVCIYHISSDGAADLSAISLQFGQLVLVQCILCGAQSHAV